MVVGRGGWLVLVAWIKKAERKPFVYLKAAVRGELEENAGAEGSDTGSVNQNNYISILPIRCL